VNDISMSCTHAAAQVAIMVKAKLSENYKITNLWPARQFLSIEIYHDTIGTGISLGQKAYITTILRRFGMEHNGSVPAPIDPNVKLDLAKDRGEMEPKAIPDYQAVMGLLMYAALATRPNISIWSRCTFSLQFAVIYQPSNHCEESRSVSHIYGQYSITPHGQWHRHRH
jgi:hypothetical protein